MRNENLNGQPRPKGRKPPIVIAAKFRYGRVVTTPGALQLLDGLGLRPMDLLKRHLEGDWGDVSDTDKALNNAALREGTRVLSAYIVGCDRAVKVWILTEADRSSTCFLLPSEY